MPHTHQATRSGRAERQNVAVSTRSTRWERLGGRSAYGPSLEREFLAGTDVIGEARFADALARPGSTILDAGSGMGRIGAALRDRGHQCYGVDLDIDLLERSRRLFPHFPVAPIRLDELTQPALTEAGFPEQYDLVLCVGNVLVYLAEGSERRVLERLCGVTAPAGRLVTGFELVATKPQARDYPEAEFSADAEASGWRVVHRFGTYNLDPFTEESDFLVAVCEPAQGHSRSR